MEETSTRVTAPHGCVNLPYSAAKTIFENVDAGYAVLVYELPGTEQAPDPNQQAADKVITASTTSVM